MPEKKKPLIILSLFLLIFFVTPLFGKDFPLSKIRNRIINNSNYTIFKDFYRELAENIPHFSPKTINLLITKNSSLSPIQKLNFQKFLSKKNIEILKSVKLLAEGYYKESMKTGKNMIAENPNSPFGNFITAYSLEKTKRYEEAIPYIKKALRFMRYSPEVYKLASIIFLKTQNVKECIKYARLCQNYDKNWSKKILKKYRVKKRIIKETKKIDYFKIYKLKKKDLIQKSSNDLIMKIGLSTKKGKVIGRKQIRFKSLDNIMVSTISQTGEIFLKNNIIHIGIIDGNKLKIDDKYFITFPIELSAKGTILIENISFGQGYPWAGTENREYRGKILLRKSGNGFILINEIDIEEYLAGVIPAEVPSSYPMEALKAQTIAARSEAIRKYEYGRHKKYGYDLCDDVCCQTYRGAGWETENTNRAINETTDLVLYGKKGVLDAVYSSCCGGTTQSSSDLKGWGKNPNLIGVSDKENEKIGNILSFLKDGKDEYCRFSESEHRWIRIIEKKLFLRNIENRYKIGKILKIVPSKRNPSGHLKKIEIIGENGKIFISRELKIRYALTQKMIRSSKFVIFEVDGEREDFVVFLGAGFGHGVGLCQVGSMGMAKSGKNFVEILKHYYKNIKISKYIKNRKKK